jgi:hypothetical protein
MQEADFYELPRAVQDRFTGCVRGEGRPVPLLVIRVGPPREVLIWSAIGAAGTLVLVIIFRLGLGDLKSSLALHPAPLIVAYAAALATMALSTLKVVARLREAWSLPYRPNIYLFPSGVVDARTNKLKVFPLSRLVQSTVGERSLGLTFPEGATFSFPLVDPGHTAEVQETIEAAQADLEKAHAANDKKSLGILDPLVDIGVANPFAPKTPLKKEIPVWARQMWVIAGAFGLALAPGFWFVRNMVSDSTMLARANRQQTVDGFKSYLARGGRRRDVADVLLPRAELSQAVKEGTVEAIEKFMAARPKPDPRIQPEISAALRQAMLTELEATKKAGTVSALTEFAKRHPNNLVDAELHQAIHAVYQTALQKYKKEWGTKEPTVLAFVEKLFAFAERSGPKVQIRFRRKLSKSMEVADAAVKKSPYFMGTPSVPSQYFDEVHARPREQAVSKALVSRFAAAFPPDILSLELGPPVTDPDAPLPPITVPTIFIEHSAEVSGASYLNANPRGVFVGLGLLFEVSFRIPDDTKPQRFRLSAWRPPDTTVSKGDETYEAAVYDAMATEGYAQFAQRYLATFFLKSEPKTSD